jgi:hypothetical protein
LLSVWHLADEDICTMFPSRHGLLPSIRALRDFSLCPELTDHAAPWRVPRAIEKSRLGGIAMSNDWTDRAAASKIGT